MKNKKSLSLCILFAGIISILVGVTYSFFNYTRTGTRNSISVGKISFNTTQNSTINLTNVFPMSSENIDNLLEEGNNVTIDITGDTTYSEGVEYLVTAEDVNITLHDKKIPISLYVSGTTDLGNNDTDYFDNRGGNTSIHKVLSGGVVYDGQYLLVGYIAKGSTGVNGSLNIKAYIDEDLIAISDTYDGTESDNMGTTNDWVKGRTVFTTSEWNSLQGNNSLSFKIRVEANEGIWVDPYTTPNLMTSLGAINKNDVKIKEIRFIHETPLRMERRYAASPGSESSGTKMDITFQDTGKVLAWIEQINPNPTGTSNELLNVKPKFLGNEDNEINIKQIDNETNYVLYIASSGDTKWIYTGNSYLFYGFSDVEKITFENFDTSSVPMMSMMFGNLSKLKYVNMSTLDTSEVVQMDNMFYNCTSLERVDLSGLGSDNLSRISNMFSNCNALTEIIMKNFNFGQVNFSQSNGGNSNYYYAFAYLPNLETIDLTNANTSGVTNMINMFYNCKKLTSIIGINTLDTSNVTNMGYMFSECDALTTLDLSGLNISSVQNMGSMFYGCDNLESVIMNGNGNGVLQNMGSMFYGCSKLTNLDLSGLGGDSLSGYSSMFSGCTKLKNINMSNFNFGQIYFGSYTSSLFRLLQDVLETINLSGANFSGPNINSNSFYFLFYGFKKLKSVDFTSAMTSKVISMNGMFESCRNLTSVIGLNTLDTSNVTGMGRMFADCSSLVSINMDGLGSNKVDDVHYMFQGCTSLKNVSMRNFNFGIANVTNNDSPFNGVSSVETIDLSYSIISDNSLNAFFGRCSNVKVINFVGVDTSNVIEMHSMFHNCSSLTTIYVSNVWNISSVTESGEMFTGCTSLVGGNGTVFDANYIDISRAHIDGSPSNPGYLTLGNA